MKKSTIAIAVLGIVIIVSNAWWANQLLDSGVSITHMSDSLRHNEKATEQLLKLLPIIARQRVQKAKIIKAACPESHVSEIFEKEGFIWAGEIGLKFDSSGKLVEVEKAF